MSRAWVVIAWAFSMVTAVALWSYFSQQLLGTTTSSPQKVEVDIEITAPAPPANVGLTEQQKKEVEAIAQAKANAALDTLPPQVDYQPQIGKLTAEQGALKGTLSLVKGRLGDVEQKQVAAEARDAELESLVADAKVYVDDHTEQVADELERFKREFQATMQTYVDNKVGGLRQDVEGQLSATAGQITGLAGQDTLLRQGLAANDEADAAERQRVDALTAEVARLNGMLLAAQNPPEEEVETSEIPAPPTGGVTTEDVEMKFTTIMAALAVGLPLAVLEAQASTPTTNPTKWMDQISKTCPAGTDIDIAIVKTMSDAQLGQIVDQCAFLQANNIGVGEQQPTAVVPPQPAAQAPVMVADGWTPNQEAQLIQLLAGKAAHVLPIQSGQPYLGYAGRATGHQGLPPGCTEYTEESGGETFVWVNCPPGMGGQPPRIAVPYNR